MTALLWAIALGLALSILGAYTWLRSNTRRKPGTGQTDRNGLGMELAEEIIVPPYYPDQKHETLEFIPEPPLKYGRDRMILMARDPNWIYAYWEISATTQKNLRQELGKAVDDSRRVLRLYDVTGVDFNGANANSYVDIPIDKHADNWHLEVGRPNRSFCVDLGCILSGGRFVTVLRSNTVATPRAGISDCQDEEWMWLEGVYRTFTRYHGGVSSPALIEERGRMGLMPAGVSSPTLFKSRKGDQDV